MREITVRVPRRTRKLAEVTYGEISVPAASRHELNAKLAELYRRGYIGQTYWLLQDKGKLTATVIQLRPFPKPSPLYVKVTGAVVMGIGGLAGLGWMIWEARYVIGMALLIAAGITVATIKVMASSGGGQCTGVHVKH